MQMLRLVVQIVVLHALASTAAAGHCPLPPSLCSNIYLHLLNIFIMVFMESLSVENEIRCSL